MPETLRINSEGNALETLLFERTGAKQVLFCHGFPGIYKHLDLAENLFNVGFGVTVMKYRGVDCSEGFFDFTSAIKDVSAVTNYLKDQAIAPNGIGIFGYSIGAYYALNVAVETQHIRSILALSPVTDLPRAARADFENIYDLMIDAQKIIRTRGVADLVASFAEVWKDFNVPERIGLIHNLPLLIIDGTSKEMGDPEQSKILYAAANEPKKTHWLEKAGHYFTEERSELSYLTQSFFAETL